MLDLCVLAVADLACVVDLALAGGSTLRAPLARHPRGRTSRNDGGFTDAVLAAADTLPIEQAQALWLVDVCGCSYEEAAIEAGANETRIATLVRQGRETIRNSVA